ncbi:MAG: alpha/beta-type small acid-soluble spore protein, partial [Defluviitaleaceae bacterium]|nr:alpha/beta-type small acid-soluble spore protein [Defluviitaleaceae bacterium]
EAMDKFKFEVANEIGVPLKQGYNGDLTSAQTGYVGGYMVKKMCTKRIHKTAKRQVFGGWVEVIYKMELMV